MRARSRSINSATDFLITPTMQAPLETSLVLRKGTGDPTYSRTTKKWGFNELGLLKEVLSGCASFDGVRLVHNTRNLTSKDITGFTKQGNVTTPSANLLVCDNATSAQYIYRAGVTGGVAVGRRYCHVIRARRVAGGVNYIQSIVPSIGFGAGQYANFSLIDGSVNAVGLSAKSVYLGNDTYDFIMYPVATTTDVSNLLHIVLANSLSSARLAAFTGDGVKSVEILRFATYDVTGYPTDYVPEYIPVGISSTPWYGAGVDGAKYFTTDYTGSMALSNLNGVSLEVAAVNSLLRSRRFATPVVTDYLSGSSWLCTQTVGGELITNGTFDTDTGWLKGATWSIGSGVATCTTASGNSLYQSLVSVGVTPGKVYVITYTLTRTAGSLIVSLGSSLTDTGKARTASGTYTDTVYCGIDSVIYFYAYGSFAGTLDDISVKECAMQIGFVTGLDGGINTATTLTASDTDAIILQTITLGSATRCGSVYVKRRTGVGTVSFTIDGGSSWTDITAQINANTWTRVQVTATLTNPSVGFKISSIGDAIDVDCVQLESGALATSPIVTTTAAVTRNADSLTYQTSGNFSDTVGTAYVEVTPTAYSGGAIGSATNGLLLSTSNSGATAFDGTNAANGPTGTPDASEKLALNWTGTAMKVASSGAVGTAGTYDGAMGLTNIGVGVGANGNFKNVAVYPYALSDSDMVKITT